MIDHSKIIRQSEKGRVRRQMLQPGARLESGASPPAPAAAHPEVAGPVARPEPSDCAGPGG
jgi:hypothetical protein